MSYSEFSLKRVKKEFHLTEKRLKLFEPEQQIEASDWLKQTLELSLDLALSSSTEKARSEFIVAPILLEMKKINQKSLAIFSGENLEAAPEKGLNGECDFILAKGPISTTLQTPIFSLVEAKKNDIKEGLGQCVAQMLGAKLVNQHENNEISFIYGCVTTGETWQFMKLEEDILMMDTSRYYINELDKLLWVFQYVIDSYKT